MDSSAHGKRCFYGNERERERKTEKIFPGRMREKERRKEKKRK